MAPGVPRREKSSPGAPGDQNQAQEPPGGQNPAQEAPENQNPGQEAPGAPRRPESFLSPLNLAVANQTQTHLIRAAWARVSKIPLATPCSGSFYDPGRSLIVWPHVGSGTFVAQVVLLLMPPRTRRCKTFITMSSKMRVCMY